VAESRFCLPDGAVSLSVKIGIALGGDKLLEISRSVTMAREFLELSDPAT
jgi:hypothetical protein